MRCLCCLGLLWVTPLIVAQDLRPVPLTAKIESVQPMTGIVLWNTNPAVETAPIQLEYSYLTYRKVITGRGEYNWQPVEDLLNSIASRKHQAILRWHDTYVGQPTGVPDWVVALPGYQTTKALSEKQPTEFPDWSHPELQRCVLDFFTAFAAKYDRDPRLAFVQVGFGLWSEYHIYDGPMQLGQTFPSLEFQAEFLQHVGAQLQQTPWMISVDAAGDQAPLADNQKLLALPFGLFDDSFNHKRHAQENEPNWKTLGSNRWQTAPTGGEFSFFEKVDQSKALAPRGPHGTPFEKHAAKFHISFMIGDAQPELQKSPRLRAAGQACGYQFRVRKFLAAPDRSVVEIENIGIAPLYYDAAPAIGDIRAPGSLKGLLPGQTREFEIAAGGPAPVLTIACDRLVPGQRIEFAADLK